MSEKLKYVLLTRPEGRNASLASELLERNIIAHELPLLKIALTSDAEEHIVELKQQLTGVVLPEIDTGYTLDSTFDFALFSSANAVLAAGNFCKNYNVVWPEELPCLGMGSATYGAVAALGWKAMLPDDPGGQKDALTSEEMLSTRWALEVQGKRILLVNGEKGRGLLAETLRQNGAAVEVVTLYRRVGVEYSGAELDASLAPLATNIDSSVILFASGDTMKNFCALIRGSNNETLLPKLRCLVPSLRVALEAREQGFERIVVSEGPGDKAFLSKLLELAA